MIFKKVITSKKESKFNLTILAEQIKNISQNHNTIAICLNNTKSSYLGVKNATLNIFPKNTLFIPAYYSQIQINDKDKKKFTDELNKLKFKQIIISGHPESLNFIVDNCHNLTSIKSIYHGALSELNEKNKDYQFKKIIEYSLDKKIKSIAFVKAGLSEWLKKSFNIKSFHIQLFTPQNDLIESKHKSKIYKIGIFGSNTFNKNIINQIAAALSLDNTEIHTFHKVEFLHFRYKDRIMYYNEMEQKELLNLMSKMDVNLHLSFSEGMGGQTFTESLGMGVPCLSSQNNQFLRNDDYLSHLLYVGEYENPTCIKNSIQNVFKENQNYLRKKIYSLINYKNKEAKLLLLNFLES